MSNLANKIDFIVLVSATMANVNGDPLNGNRPRIDFNGFGEMSDVCIKRKIRNRMLDLGNHIFVQSDDKNIDGYSSLSERASKTLGKSKDKEDYTKKACAEWLDVRTFGQVFAFSSGKKKTAVFPSVSAGRSPSIRPSAFLPWRFSPCRSPRVLTVNREKKRLPILWA